MAPELLRFHFVLPFSGRKPVGGFKVVYEYANELVRRGHAVCITHTAGLYLGVNSNDKVWLNVAKFFLFGLLQNYRPNRWFTLDSRVQTLWRPSLHSLLIHSADFIIATSWETAEWVANYPQQKGEKAYLIQGLEDWQAPTERVLKTWKSIPKKIVISKWLGEIAEKLDESYCYIPNGLDFCAFGIDINPEHRNPKSVLMLHHDQPVKGTAFGMKAIELVKSKVPEATITVFGTKRPSLNVLPEWLNFEVSPTPKKLRELYNSHAIFISPSVSEGWALPPAEAMQCGCATVLTAIGGHEYAIDGLTSLLCPPKDPNKMAEQILYLIENPSRRINLGKVAHREIAQYTWPLATDRLLEYLKG